MAGSYEQKPNTGSLFRNDKKEEDRHPDYNGSFNIDGSEFWINAWLKTSKDGKKYMSLSVKPKEARGGGGQRGGGGGGRGESSYAQQRGGGSAGPAVGGSWRDKKEPDDIPFNWLIVAGTSFALLALGTANGLIT